MKVGHAYGGRSHIDATAVLSEIERRADDGDVGAGHFSIVAVGCSVSLEGPSTQRRVERRVKTRENAEWLASHDFYTKAFEFLRQVVQRDRASLEGMVRGLLLEASQDLCHGVGADVGARTLAVVRQAHGLLGVLTADGVIQQDDLLRRVVEQGGEHLTHQFVVVQRDVPQLTPVQHGCLIDYMHDLIVPLEGRRRPSSEALSAPSGLPYLGRATPNEKEDSITCMRESKIARATNPGASGVPKRRSKTSTSLPFSTSG